MSQEEATSAEAPVEEEAPKEEAPVEEETPEEEKFNRGDNDWRTSLVVGRPAGDSGVQRIFKFVFPVALWGLSFLVAQMIWMVQDADQWFTYSFMYLVPPFGKETIIPMGMGYGFGPLTMAFTVAFVDLWVAMFVSWNYWYITKIPKVGKYLEKAEAKGANTMKKIPSLEKGAFWGIVMLSLIPAVGAGGFFGSIIGKMIGMKPGSVIAAVFLGSFASGLLYAFAFDAFVAAFDKYPYLTVLVLATVIIGGLLYFFWFKRSKAKLEEKEAAAAA